MWGRLKNIQQTDTTVIKSQSVFYEMDISISLTSTFSDKLQGSQFNRKLLGWQQGWCFMEFACNYLIHPFPPRGLSSFGPEGLCLGPGQQTLPWTVLAGPLPAFDSLTLPMPPASQPSTYAQFPFWLMQSFLRCVKALHQDRLKSLYCIRYGNILVYPSRAPLAKGDFFP